MRATLRRARAIMSLAALPFLRIFLLAVRARVSNSLPSFLPPVLRAAFATRPTSPARAPSSAVMLLPPALAPAATIFEIREPLRLMVLDAALAPDRALAFTVFAALRAAVLTAL